MSSRSLNKVQLIGNLTRDPELRYTPQGTPVCTIGLATNRSWSDSSGQRQEETEFHRIVAWSKLAELCDQLLFKGRKIYVEGRLQTRRWSSQDGTERQTTEVVIDDMIILDSKRKDDNSDNKDSYDYASESQKSNSKSKSDDSDDDDDTDKKSVKKDTKKSNSDKSKTEEVSADDIAI